MPSLTRAEAELVEQARQFARAVVLPNAHRRDIARALPGPAGGRRPAV